MGKIRRISISKILKPTLILSIIFCASFLSAKQTNAASYVAQYVGAAINGTWVKVSTSGPVNIDLVPTATGTLGVNKGTVNVETNSSTGYRLYLSGINAEDNGYTSLYYNGNPNASTKLRSTTAAPTTPSPLSAGEWGWASPTDTSAYDAVLNTGSTSETSVINNLNFAGIKKDYTFIKSTDASNENHPDNIDIYYGALADNSTPYGSYYNVIVYTAFVEGGNNIVVTPNRITDGETITIATEIQDSATPVSADRISLQIYDPANPTQNIGTCTNLQITKNGTLGNPLTFTCDMHLNADGKPYVNYGLKLSVDIKDNGVYLTYDAPSILSFYESPTTLADATYMQDITPEICAATPTWDESNTTYTLTDSRDGKKYLVRKLKDNRCWMAQNLALEGGANLNSTDSDLPDGETYTITSDGNLRYGMFVSDTTEEMVNDTHVDASNDNITDNKGAHYNWNVATAGYDTLGSKDSGNADKSICPRGWKLPTADAGGDFNELYRVYSNRLQTNIAFNHSAFTGAYDCYSLVNLGGGAYWWSATILNNTDAHNVEDYDGAAYGISQHRRGLGLSIRCVASN